MGLDAFVRCRCWQDGLTTEPPVPRELIVEDDEGCLTLRLPYEGNEEPHHLLDSWLRSGACAHPRMAYASEHISNWSGYRLFQQALRSAGCEHFPVLCGELPNANGGLLPTESARRALEELARFVETAFAGARTRLVDDETGSVLATHVAAYSGVFMYDGSTGHHVGVDPHGFFVLDTTPEPNEEIFRASTLTQEVVADRLVRFTDLDGGAVVTVELSGPVRAEPGGSHPRRLRVETVLTDTAEFGYILEPLTTVFRASIETGNPVHWY